MTNPQLSGAPRPDVDWALVRSAYEAGGSVAALAKEHDVSESAIRKRITRHRWQRDALKKPIQDRVQRALVIHEGEDAHQRVTDEEVIGRIAYGQVGVVRSHRERAKRTLGMVTTLEEQLDLAIGSRDSFQQAIEEMQREQDPKNQNPQRYAALMRAVSLPVHIQAMKDLALTIGKLVNIERQAFGLAENDDPDKEKPDDDSVSPTAASLAAIRKKLEKQMAKGAAN